jgi:hypothetical protein
VHPYLWQNSRFAVVSGILLRYMISSPPQQHEDNQTQRPKFNHHATSSANDYFFALYSS